MRLLVLAVAVTLAPVSEALAEGFTVGGAIYTDLNNVLTSGLAGVTVTITGDNGTFSAISIAPLGIWPIHNVPSGVYTVMPVLEGWCFKHIVSGVVGDPAPITITVDEEHLAKNQSIQFLAETCATTPEGDVNGDGEVDQDDLAAFANCLTGPGGNADAECESADLDADGDVDLGDFARLQIVFAGG